MSLISHSAQVSTHGISWKLPDKGINISCSPLFIHVCHININETCNNIMYFVDEA